MPFPDDANVVLLDDFNRADVGPPPSASWTDKVLSADANGLKVLSNVLAPGGAPTVPASSYWSAATFGPDVQAYVTVSTVGTAQVRCWARVANPGAVGTTNGYFVNNIPATSLRIFRVDNDVATQLTSNLGAAAGSGDKFGIECAGTKISAYLFTAGSWSQTASITDATYSAAGYVGLRISSDAAGRLDDFSAGTTSTYPTARTDFNRSAVFPFAASDFVGRQLGGSSVTQSPSVGSGPAPYGGFERFLAPRLHQDFTAASSSSETPPPGGATAGGFGPVAQAATPQGGATGLGNTPLPSTAVPQGGAVAAGQAVTATVTVTAGGALAGGQSVATRATAPQGGGVAAGNTPSPTTTVTAGGALAAGPTPAPRTTVPQGGAVGAGATPAPQTTLTQGGGTAAGLGAPAFVNLSPGGAIAGGFAPSDGAAVTETPTPGGAIAAGVTPTATVALVISGATAQGRAVTLALVPLTPGGATAGGQLTDPLAVTPRAGTQDMAVFISNW